MDENEEAKRLPKATSQGWEGGTLQLRWQLKDFTPRADLALLLEEPLVLEAAQKLAEVVTASEEDPRFLKGKSARELQLLRNTPAALLGYTFKDASLRKYFEEQPWYVARADHDPKWLSSSDQKFMAAVKAAEAEVK